MLPWLTAIALAAPATTLHLIPGEDGVAGVRVRTFDVADDVHGQWVAALAPGLELHCEAADGLARVALFAEGEVDWATVPDEGRCGPWTVGVQLERPGEDGAAAAIAVALDWSGDDLQITAPSPRAASFTLHVTIDGPSGELAWAQPEEGLAGSTMRVPLLLPDECPIPADASADHRLSVTARVRDASGRTIATAEAPERALSWDDGVRLR